MNLKRAFHSLKRVYFFADDKRPSEGLHDPAYKKTKKDYSVSSDPNASDVYKSLFTTHKDAKTHNKAHWVTYNPFYNWIRVTLCVSSVQIVFL